MSLTSSARFYRQLSLIHRAGIALAQSVDLAGRVSGGHHAVAARTWSAGCSRGSALAEQMEGTLEPSMAVALVRAGEKSGRLPEIATSLADYYDHMIQLRSELISKLWYPAILVHVALVIPAVPGLFKDQPLWTLLIGPGVLWLLIGALLAAYFFTRASGLMSRLVMVMPLSFLVMPLLEVNTYRVLRLAFTAGMLTPDALELAAGGCGARAMGTRLREAASLVRNGGLPSLAAALEHCRFPETGVGLVANGEVSGKTEETLRQAEILAQDRFDTRTRYTLRILSGTIYALVMVLAAFVIISMYSGYLGQINSIGKEMDQ